MNDTELARETMQEIRALEAELPDWLRGVVRERFDHDSELCNLDRLIEDPGARNLLWPLLPPLHKLAEERLYQTHLARAIAEAYARALEDAPEELRQWATAYRLNVRLRCPTSGPYKTRTDLAEVGDVGEEFAQLYAPYDLKHLSPYAEWVWGGGTPPGGRVYLVMDHGALRFLLVRASERKEARKVLGLPPDRALSEALFAPFRGLGWWARPGLADFIREHLRLFPPEVAQIARGKRVDLSRWTEAYRNELLEQGREWRGFLAREFDETPTSFALEIPFDRLPELQRLSFPERGKR